MFFMLGFNVLLRPRPTKPLGPPGYKPVHRVEHFEYKIVYFDFYCFGFFCEFVDIKIFDLTF